jgi:hypothetical protein
MFGAARRTEERRISMSAVASRAALLLSSLVLASSVAAAGRAADTADAARQRGVGDSVAGRAFAVQVRTPCHVVAPDQLSPFRFRTGSDFQAIADTSGQTAMSLVVWLTATPHPSMPNPRLTSEEAKDVIAYILSLRSRR